MSISNGQESSRSSHDQKSKRARLAITISQQSSPNIVLIEVRAQDKITLFCPCKIGKSWHLRSCAPLQTTDLFPLQLLLRKICKEADYKTPVRVICKVDHINYYSNSKRRSDAIIGSYNPLLIRLYALTFRTFWFSKFLIFSASSHFSSRTYKSDIRE